MEKRRHEKHAATVETKSQYGNISEASVTHAVLYKIEPCINLNQCSC
jgi:hypothetical protein